MNRKEYEEKRAALYAEAQALLEAGKVAEAEAKMNEIQELDKAFEAAALAAANLAALKENNAVAKPASASVVGAQAIATANEAEAAAVHTVDSKAYEVAWAKNALGIRMTAEEQNVFDAVNPARDANAYTHTTENTGILIPTTVVNGILEYAAEQYPFYGGIQRTFIPGRVSYKIHTAITAGDAKWYAESAKTDDEQNTFAELLLDGRELAKKVVVSWKLKAMAVEQFIPYITRELGDRFAVTLGVTAFAGKGGTANPPEPLGMVTAVKAEASKPQVVTYLKGKAPTYQNIVDAISKVESRWLSGSAFYAQNSYIWSALAGLVDGNGKPIFIADPEGGRVGYILGFPVHADGGTPDKSVAFGNVGAMKENVSEQMKLVTAEDVDNRATKFVGYMVTDFAPITTKAFALIEESAT